MEFLQLLLPLLLLLCSIEILRTVAHISEQNRFGWRGLDERLREISRQLEKGGLR